MQVKKIQKFAALVLCTAALSSCIKPYQEKQYVQIGANETAYLLPLEGANQSEQGTFDSESYLNDMKVATKRIEIRTRWHQTSRYSWQGKWVKMDTCIVVKRAPVTATWTNDQAIKCESQESVEWRQNVTVTVFVEEANASKFLYQYGGKSLQQVLNTDIKAVVASSLSAGFAQFPLAEARTKKAEVYTLMEDAVREAFEPFGITVRSVGASGGFNYIDATIQSKINDEFASTLALEIARNQASAAREFARSAEAMEERQKVENLKLLGEARAEAVTIKASRWNGAYPSQVTFLNSGEEDMSNFLMSLDQN